MSRSAEVGRSGDGQWDRSFSRPPALTISRLFEIQPVRLRRGPVEERLLLGSGISGSHALESVPHDREADGLAVRREIALEHATLGTELVDAVPEQRPPRPGELVRRRGPREPVEAESEIGHAEPAQ